MLPVSNLPAASALDSPFQSESAAPGGTRSLRSKRRPAGAPAPPAVLRQANDVQRLAAKEAFAIAEP
ncbi:MAG TPA: hypothetical protein VL919_06135, partial [Vicinamibacterales bacterium]|nr:hypothetical protein [Vicinamibacterales bacterium]